MEQKAIKRTGPVFYLKCLLFSYIITGLLLMLLAFLLYKMKLSQEIVSVGIIVVYVIATFFAGFATGKKVGERKFLWGLLMGAAYFLILTVVSLIVNHSARVVIGNFATVFCICAGSGMLGGMVS